MDAVKKKKITLMESLKRKRSEPGTPSAKEQKENNTLKMKERKETDSGAGSSKDMTGTDYPRNENTDWERRKNYLNSLTGQ